MIFDAFFSSLAQMAMPMPGPMPGMSGPMPGMSGESMVMAPHWLVMLLSMFFLKGVLFYIIRLWSPAYLTRVNGYADSENELWHGLCLLAMAQCLTPMIIPVPTLVWLWVLPVGVLGYLVRAFTYGQQLPHNKQWYDFAHAAMLFGMWWMFAQPLSGALVTLVFAVYWAWFGSYYSWRLVNDLRRPHWLSFGQNTFHLCMAIVMFVMTVWPNYLMIM